MINKLKNLYYSIRYSNTVSRLLYSRKLRIKIISSLIFIVLFVLVCVVFEFLYRGSVVNQINDLIHNVLFFGL
jgi:hypothetical protein